MLKIKAKNAIIIVLAIACCVLFGVVGLKTTAKAESSAVQTVYSESDVKISQAQPYSFKLGREGQYCITVDVDKIVLPDEESLEIFFTIGDVTRYLTYSYYNDKEDRYTGVVDVTENDNITVETNSEQILNATITLETLYLGEKNDYILPQVKISPKPLSIDFLGSANAYILTVEVLDLVEEISETELYVKIGNQNVMLERMYEGVNIFTGEFMCEQTMTISAKNSYTVNISAGIAPTNKPLPESVELTTWKTETYSYIQDYKTGYYVISAVSNNETFNVNVFFKTELMTTEGIKADPKTPLYMEEGNMYFFEVTLISDNYKQESATVTFEINAWAPPTVNHDNTYEVPVTPTYEFLGMYIDVDPGTYNLAIVELPILLEGVVITAHIGGYGEVLLTPENSYMAEVELSREQTFVYFTANERFIIKIFINYLLDREFVEIDRLTQIYLEAGASVYYFIEGAEEGKNYYNITLSDTEIKVYLGFFLNSIVPQGETQGGFVIRKAVYPIEFKNNTTSGKYFDFIITKAEENLLKMENNDINIPAGEDVTYYADNLFSGFYKLDFGDIIGDIDDIVIYTYEAGAYKEIPIEDNIVKITINEYYEYGARFLFKNNGVVPFSSKASIDVPVEKKKYPDVWNPGSVGTRTYNYIKVYLKVDNPGTYVFEAKLPEGVYIYMTADNKDIVNYGYTTGEFTINESGYVAILIYAYNYGMETEFEYCFKSISG